MKVFVVTWSVPYEFDRVLGVCLSKKEAEEMFSKYMNEENEDGCWVREHEMDIIECEIGKCLY